MDHMVRVAIGTNTHLFQTTILKYPDGQYAVRVQNNRGEEPVIAFFEQQVDGYVALINYPLSRRSYDLTDDNHLEIKVSSPLPFRKDNMRFMWAFVKDTQLVVNSPREDHEILQAVQTHTSSSEAVTVVKARRKARGGIPYLATIQVEGRSTPLDLAVTVYADHTDNDKIMLKVSGFGVSDVTAEFGKTSENAPTAVASAKIPVVMPGIKGGHLVCKATAPDPYDETLAVAWSWVSELEKRSLVLNEFMPISVHMERGTRGDVHVTSVEQTPSKGKAMQFLFFVTLGGEVHITAHMFKNKATGEYKFRVAHTSTGLREAKFERSGPHWVAKVQIKLSALYAGTEAPGTLTVTATSADPFDEDMVHVNWEWVLDTHVEGTGSMISGKHEIPVVFTHKILAGVSRATPNKLPGHHAEAVGVQVAGIGMAEMQIAVEKNFDTGELEVTLKQQQGAVAVAPLEDSGATLGGMIEFPVSFTKGHGDLLCAFSSKKPFNDRLEVQWMYRAKAVVAVPKPLEHHVTPRGIDLGVALAMTQIHRVSGQSIQELKTVTDDEMTTTVTIGFGGNEEQHKFTVTVQDTPEYMKLMVVGDRIFSSPFTSTVGGKTAISRIPVTLKHKQGDLTVTGRINEENTVTVTWKFVEAQMV